MAEMIIEIEKATNDGIDLQSQYSSLLFTILLEIILGLKVTH
jgi:hypothetical protein